MKKSRIIGIIITTIFWIFVICLIIIKPFRSFVSEVVLQHRFGFLIVLFLIVILLIYNPLKSKNKEENDAIDNLKDIPIEELNKLNINIDEFKVETFKLFKDIEQYWINKNDDKLRFLLSEDLYNEYKKEVAVLDFNKQKNIIDNIELLDIKITKLYNEGNDKYADVYLKISLYDYIVDENNNVIRGFNDKKKEDELLLTFLIKKHLLDKCPYCMAPLDDNKNMCSYCGKLIDNRNEYILSKKEELRKGIINE